MKRWSAFFLATCLTFFGILPAVSASPACQEVHSRRAVEATHPVHAILAKAERKFIDLFRLTSGFQTIEEFNRTIAEGPEFGARLLKDLQSGDLTEIAIYQPEERRDQISTSGFLNQHTTGFSKSSEFDPALRNLAEATMLGMSLEEYKALPSEWKAKSALLQPTLRQDFERQGNLMYGEDGFILDEHSLSDRLTITAEDSLNRFINGNKIIRGKKYVAQAVERWDQMYIPWRLRSLMIPYLIPQLTLWNRFNPSGDPYFFMDKRPPIPPHFLKLQSMTPTRILEISPDWEAGNQNYVEVQIWGTVNLDHVKAFQFSRKPPSGAFLQALLQRGIEIRDARGLRPSPNTGFTARKPVIWKPGDP